MVKHITNSPNSSHTIRRPCNLNVTSHIPKRQHQRSFVNFKDYVSVLCLDPVTWRVIGYRGCSAGGLSVLVTTVCPLRFLERSRSTYGVGSYCSAGYLERTEHSGQWGLNRAYNCLQPPTNLTCKYAYGFLFITLCNPVRLQMGAHVPSSGPSVPFTVKYTIKYYTTHK